MHLWAEHPDLLRTEHPDLHRAENITLKSSNIQYFHTLMYLINSFYNYKNDNTNVYKSFVFISKKRTQCFLKLNIDEANKRHVKQIYLLG